MTVKCPELICAHKEETAAYAILVELVDTSDLSSDSERRVWVRVPQIAFTVCLVMQKAIYCKGFC